MRSKASGVALYLLVLGAVATGMLAKDRLLKEGTLLYEGAQGLLLGSLILGLSWIFRRNAWSVPRGLRLIGTIGGGVLLTGIAFTRGNADASETWIRASEASLAVYAMILPAYNLLFSRDRN